MSEKDSFFPDENYNIPSTSNYLNKLPEGETVIRIMSRAIVGYEYFNKQKKPVRSREPFEEIPADIQDDGRVSHFWAFLVWNYEAKRLQIFEVTQKTIQSQIKALHDNPKWGGLFGYDISINRKGKTMNDTEYSVIPNPHSPTPEEATESFTKKNIDLALLYEGKDPFALE